MALIDRVLTDPAGEAPLDALEAGCAARRSTGTELVHDTKRAVADGILRSEVRRIARELLAALDAPTGAPTRDIEDAVAELLACFPVYRSYLPAGASTSTRRSPWPARTAPTWPRRSTCSRRCSPTRGRRRRCASSRPAAW